MPPQHLQHYDADADGNDAEFDVEMMLGATDAASSSRTSAPQHHERPHSHRYQHGRQTLSSTKHNRRQHNRNRNHKHNILPTRRRSPRKRSNTLVAPLFAFIGCLALLGTVTTTLDLATYTRRLQTRARRLATCVVNMGWAVGEGEMAIQSSFVTWEAMFSRSYVQEKRGAVQHNNTGSSPSLPPQTDLAFVLALTACPDDEVLPGVDNRYDPRHAFFDAAAMLKYSLCEECAEVNVASKYNHTLYGIVHPQAQFCSVDGRGEYDRVAVLQSLGYRVEVKGEPVGIQDVSDPYLSANVESDVGIRDLMKLHAYTLTQHKVVVLIDFSTMLLQPLDDAIDDLMASPSAGAAFAMDYATQLPANGLNHGANMGLFMLKPSFAAFTELVDLYKTTAYDSALGWNSQGVAGFEGSMGTSGLLTHYYRSKAFIELDKCIYNNDAGDPHTVGEFCRDGNAQCNDCRLTITNKIEAGRFVDSLCGKPWKCSWDENWDDATKQVCREYHQHWFANRERFEVEFWIGGPQPMKNGTLHTDIFRRYCSFTGVDGYEPMIPDNYSPVDSGTTTTVARR